MHNRSLVRTLQESVLVVKNTTWCGKNIAAIILLHTERAFIDEINSKILKKLNKVTLNRLFQAFENRPKLYFMAQHNSSTRRTE